MDSIKLSHPNLDNSLLGSITQSHWSHCVSVNNYGEGDCGDDGGGDGGSGFTLRIF